jgi:putative transposase
VKKDIGVNSEIWERGYVDHRIRDGANYDHHREYIRQNPIKSGLVDAPEQYRYCSAYPGAKLDPAPQGLKPLFEPAA